jgi:hypothetical protein
VNNFKPVNRYIQIDLETRSEKEESIVLLPENFKKPEEKYVQCVCLSSADDVRFFLKPKDELIIDRKMVEEITVNHKVFHVILDNYVLGVVQKE